jgi:hypothetical protein
MTFFDLSFFSSTTYHIKNKIDSHTFRMFWHFQCAEMLKVTISLPLSMISDFATKGQRTKVKQG